MPAVKSSAAAPPDYVDVLVVGAGPTGLALANLLGAYGVRTLIIEAHEQTSELPRAIVLDDEGARTLQAFGLADEVTGDALIGERTRYEAPDGKVILEVGPGSDEYGFRKRHFIAQPRLERSLDSALARWPGVTRCFATRLLRFASEADGVVATVARAEGERTIRSRWLIACDGGRSPVRERLGVAFGGATYSQDWVVLDFAADPTSGTTTRFICDPARPAVIVPAPRGGRRYEFMLLPGEAPERALAPEFLSQLLAPYRGFLQGDVIRAAVYTFHARVAAAWRQGRVLLAGDAAHLTPPFAGQGMNAGLRDSSNLAWKLAMHARGIANDTLLDSYELERRGPCEAMIRLAVLMGKVIMPRNAEEARLHDAVMRLTEEAPELERYLFEMRFKPRPAFSAGVFVRAPDEAPGSLVGCMAPQPDVEAGGRRMRLDDAIGNGFVVLAQDPAVAAAFGASDPFWRKLDIRCVLLRRDPRAQTVPGWGDLLTVDPIRTAPLRAHRDQLIVLRPDRYVAGAFGVEDTSAFVDAFARLVTPGAADVRTTGFTIRHTSRS